MSTLKSNNWWEEGEMEVKKEKSRIRRIRTDSSFITAIGYDEKAGILEVLLRGQAYHYKGVEKEIFKKFKKADSKGSFYHKYIKHQYSSLKLDLCWIIGKEDKNDLRLVEAKNHMEALGECDEKGLKSFGFTEDANLDLERWRMDNE